MAEASPASSAFSLSLEEEQFILKGSNVIAILGLECTICNELFDSSKRSPKLLPCNHTICQSCLEKMPTSVCPVCRGSISMANVSNDFKVRSGLEAIAEAKTEYKNSCFKHNFQSLDRFCTYCVSPVCSDCVRLEHGDEAHVLTGLGEALRENESRFDDFQRKCKESLNRMKERQLAIQNIIKKLNTRQEDEVKKMGDMFNYYCALLVSRKETLVEDVERKINQRKLEMATESEQIEKEIAKVQKLNNSMECARQVGDSREIFKLQKIFIQEENDICKDFDNEELCKWYEIKALNEERLKAVLASVGDVSVKLDVSMMQPEYDNDNDDTDDNDHTDDNDYADDDC